MAYQIANLPVEIRQQVEDYIEFLLRKYAPKSQDNPRLLAYGLYKGQIRMSDDFDAPLEDFKEYM